MGLLYLVVRSFKTVKDPHDVDLSSLGNVFYGGPTNTGDSEMITRLEQKLKKATKK